jgi:hypothetical protein
MICLEDLSIDQDGLSQHFRVIYIGLTYLEKCFIRNLDSIVNCSQVDNHGDHFGHFVGFRPFSKRWT